MISRCYLVVTLAVLSCLFAWPAAAEWSHDPMENNPVCTADGLIDEHRMVSDGEGGAILVWLDYRSVPSGEKLYAQRVDADGNMLWSTDGVAVCTAMSSKAWPQLVSDGAGGAIITWADDRNAPSIEVYVQRVDPDGNMLWTTDGVAICPESGYQESPELVSDGAGGAIIAWIDSRWWNDDIWAQRVDPEGNLLWSAAGQMVCVDPEEQKYLQAVSDGDGGAIICWADKRNVENRTDIYAQRMGADGSVCWAPDGIAVSTLADDQNLPQLAGDGQGGAIMVWRDNEDLTRADLSAQRISAAGALLWPTNGVKVRESPTEPYFQHNIISDGEGGVLICWQELHVEELKTIRAQRLSGSGELLWASEGEIVRQPIATTSYPVITDDGLGGAIIAWMDDRSDSWDIRAQRLDANGTALWLIDGVAVCLDDEQQGYPEIVSDAAGGAIMLWEDTRYWEPSDGNDLYAQQVDADGLLGGPENQPPVAVAEASPTFGYAPLTVNFSAMLSQDPEGTPLDYFWDFGDPGSPSNTSDQENPTHVYQNPGSYTAWLTVSDGELTDSTPVSITATSTVSADLVCSPDMGVLPFDCQVTATVTNQCLQFPRRVAARVDLFLPSGEFITNYRRGYVNLAPAGSREIAWTEHLVSSSTVGFIEAQLLVQDVTPSPYNQPPYPGSSSTAGAGCLVEVLAE